MSYGHVFYCYQNRLVFNTSGQMFMDKGAPEIHRTVFLSTALKLAAGSLAFGFVTGWISATVFRKAGRRRKQSISPLLKLILLAESEGVSEETLRQVVILRIPSEVRQPSSWLLCDADVWDPRARSRADGQVVASGRPCHPLGSRAPATEPEVLVMASAKFRPRAAFPDLYVSVHAPLAHADVHPDDLAVARPVDPARARKMLQLQRAPPRPPYDAPCLSWMVCPTTMRSAPAF